MDDLKVDWLTIGNRIAEMRLSRGLTQLQLAELTGLSRVYIGYIEQGKRCGTILTYLTCAWIRIRICWGKSALSWPQAGVKRRIRSCGFFGNW